MQRITITIDDDLMKDLDQIIETRAYQNRSEAIRDLARAGLQQATQHVSGGCDCVGALVLCLRSFRAAIGKPAGALVS